MQKKKFRWCKFLEDMGLPLSSFLLDRGEQKVSRCLKKTKIKCKKMQFSRYTKMQTFKIFYVLPLVFTWVSFWKNMLCAELYHNYNQK